MSVKGFQIIWNTLLPDVASTPGLIFPSKNNGRLDDDGLYGEQTSTALSNFITSSRRPPSRASDMPVWVASNSGSVAAMCPPQPPIAPVPAAPHMPPSQTVPMPSVPVELEPVPVSTVPQDVPVDYVKTLPSGPVIEVGVPSMPEVVEISDGVVIVAADPERIKRDLDVADAPSLIPADQPQMVIRARPRSGDVPVMALAAGGVVVAGILAWMIYGKKKR
jgi:hypothetical protein